MNKLDEVLELWVKDSVMEKRIKNATGTSLFMVFIFIFYFT
jgi:hypothetical protein